MKTLCLMAAFAVSCLSAPTGIRTVYILPMAGGLDQYLAAWLTHDHVLEVVADPKLADAVITDTLGEPFEQKMAQIRPPAAAPDSKDKADSSAMVHTFRSGSSKGTVFLVDAKTRVVVWSDYEKAPRSITNANLNREARRVAKKLADTGTPADAGANKTER
jgi:hypothetical protein